MMTVLFDLKPQVIAQAYKYLEDYDEDSKASRGHFEQDLIFLGNNHLQSGKSAIFILWGLKA